MDLNLNLNLDLRRSSVYRSKTYLKYKIRLECGGSVAGGVPLLLLFGALGLTGSGTLQLLLALL
eukprot:SAG22_NODE_14410_length_375_cov_0.934783_1_plen_63_part_10